MGQFSAETCATAGSVLSGNQHRSRHRGECATQGLGKKEIALSPIAIEVVRRIDALFEIERPINGKSAGNVWLSGGC